jgi:hypothetical protein
MKTLGCDFCSNWQNIEPAKYIAIAGNTELERCTQQANMDKKFFLLTPSGFVPVEKCPICGYIFTTEDYDNY